MRQWLHVLMLLVAAFRLQATPLPELPVQCMQPEETAVLRGITEQLRNGQFTEAAARLRLLTPVRPARVWLSAPALPEARRREAQASMATAIQQWNQALRSTAFTVISDPGLADVWVSVEWNVVRNGSPVLWDWTALHQEPAFPNRPARRTIAVRLSAFQPGSWSVVSPNVWTHAIAQALGAYLGLARTPGDQGVMGDVPARGAGVPSPAEREAVRQIDAYRAALARMAAEHRTPPAETPLLTATPSVVSAGEVVAGRDAPFTFRVHNSGDRAIRIRLYPTCSCTVLSDSAEVPAHGEVDIHGVLHTRGFRGDVRKVIEVGTGDDTQPTIPVTVTAHVVPLFTAQPEPTGPLVVNDGAPVTATWRVSARDGRTVGGQPVCSASWASAIWTRQTESDGMVTLTVHPTAPYGVNNLSVTLPSGRADEPAITWVIPVHRGFVLKPSVLYLGVITPATPLPLKRTLEVTGSSPWRITEVSSSHPALTCTLSEQGTSRWSVEIVMAARPSQGPFDAIIRIHTDNPEQPVLECTVMGSVER